MPSTTTILLLLTILWAAAVIGNAVAGAASGNYTPSLEITTWPGQLAEPRAGHEHERRQDEELGEQPHHQRERREHPEHDHRWEVGDDRAAQTQAAWSQILSVLDAVLHKGWDKERVIWHLESDTSVHYDFSKNRRWE